MLYEHISYKFTTMACTKLNSIDSNATKEGYLTLAQIYNISLSE